MAADKGHQVEVEQSDETPVQPADDGYGQCDLVQKHTASLLRSEIVTKVVCAAELALCWKMKAVSTKIAVYSAVTSRVVGMTHT